MPQIFALKTCCWYTSERIKKTNKLTNELFSWLYELRQQVVPVLIIAVTLVHCVFRIVIMIASGCFNIRPDCLL